VIWWVGPPILIAQSLQPLRVATGLAETIASGDLSVAVETRRTDEFGEMIGAGAVAVSDDGKPVASAQLLLRSFRRTVLLAAGIGAASAFVGLIIGQAAQLSISGCIVLVAAAVFTVASVVRRSLPAAVESQV